MTGDGKNVGLPPSPVLRPVTRHPSPVTHDEGELVRVEIDPRVGGTFLFTDRRAEGDIDHVGEYLEIDRPRRLVFTLKVPFYSQDADTIAVDIVPLNTGCELTITHAMSAENAEWLEPTTQGWAQLMDVLESKVTGDG